MKKISGIIFGAITDFEYTEDECSLLRAAADLVSRKERAQLIENIHATDGCGDEALRETLSSKSPPVVVPDISGEPDE